MRERETDEDLVCTHLELFDLPLELGNQTLFILQFGVESVDLHVLPGERQVEKHWNEYIQCSYVRFIRMAE